MYRYDDSIQSNNLPTQDNTMFMADYNMYRGMVISVTYTDSPTNITKNSTSPRVLYDVILIGGNNEGQILTNCRLSSIIAGAANSYERVLRSTTKDLIKDPLNQHDGDIVFIQFVQGHSNYPIITSLDESFNKASSGAKASDGARLLSEFNGVRELINKDGEYCLLRRGGEINADTGLFEATPEDSDPNFEGRLKLLKNTMIWEDPKSSITFLKEEETITTVAGDDSVVITVDGKNESILRKFKSGLEILENGKGDSLEIKSNSGVSILVDGNGSKVVISQGSTQIIMDGNSGKISLSGGLIDLGSSISDFAVLFTQLSNTFNTHTHLVPQATSGTLPSAAPTVPMTPSVRSNTIKVQS